MLSETGDNYPDCVSPSPSHSTGLLGQRGQATVALPQGQTLVHWVGVYDVPSGNLLNFSPGPGHSSPKKQEVTLGRDTPPLANRFALPTRLQDFTGPLGQSPGIWKRPRFLEKIL